MDETQRGLKREQLIALYRRRGSQRALDAEAALPGEELLLRQVIASCTEAARRIYRRKPSEGRFSLVDVLSPTAAAEFDARAAQEMNWEELLVWGSTLDLAMELSGKTRIDILKYALTSCDPTNRQLLELELARIARETATQAFTTLLGAVVETVLPAARAGKKHHAAQRERAKKKRSTNRVLFDGTRYEQVVEGLRYEKKEGRTEKELWASFIQRLNDTSSSPVESASETGDLRKNHVRFDLQNRKSHKITFARLQNAISGKKGKLHD